MKRVTVFVNKNADGKVLLVVGTFEEFLKSISNKFKVDIKRIFSKDGGEIDDTELIFDGDILHATNGASFNNQAAETINSTDTRTCKTGYNNEDKDNQGRITSRWITLNVGGKYFTTSRSTLTEKEPTSMLARMFAEGEDGYLFTPSNIDSQGAYLIDRSPTYFEPIINYLRNGQIIYDLNVNPEGILEEAKYYGIESMIPELESIVKNCQKHDDMPLRRCDVITSIITTPITSVLRFQGVNLSGADLSKLDLRFINFKYACLSKCKLNGANLSWCCLERADLSHCCLAGAQLLGVKSLCANFEGSDLQGCNFEDPGGRPANLEGVNLKGANLEGSNLTGINLRVATLKNANLKNCDLRAAVLAGADLECCDLSGSDLQEANLRGANLKNAAFELMLTPLHMSQTIR